MNKKTLLGTTLAGIALTGTMLSGVSAQANTPKAEAPAPTVTKKDVPTQEQKSSTDYWTPERMKNAVNADLVLDPAAKPSNPLLPEGIKGPDGPRVDIPGQKADPEAQQKGTLTRMAGNERPVKHIGKVFFTGWNKDKQRYDDFVCSANSVTSANKNTVSTAGHCLNSEGRYATKFVFVPAYENGRSPYGMWPAQKLLANSAWTQREDLTEDTGFAVLAQLNGRNLADVVGASGVTFNAPRGQNYKAFGYPAEHPFNGETLKSCTGTASNDSLRPGTTQGIICDMTGGSSGGPWFLNGDVNGNQNTVNSYGYRGGDKMFAPYWDNSIQSLYQSAQR